MELSDNKGSSKDEAMKHSFDAQPVSAEKKETKEKKKEAKNSIKTSSEKQEEPPLHSDSDKAEKKTPSFLQEIFEEDGKAKEKALKESTEAVDEKEVPLESLGEAEQVDVAGAYVEASIVDTSVELSQSEPDSSAELEAAASLAFYESLEDKLQEEPEVDDVMLENAANQALESLQIPVASAEIDETEQSEPQEIEAVDEDNNELDSEPEETIETTHVETTTADETEQESDDDEVQNQTNGSNVGAAPPLPPNANNVNAPNQAVPPGAGQNIPPVSPPGGGAGGGLPPSPGNMNFPNNGPNMNIQTPNPNIIVNRITVEQHNRNRGRDILVGGVVGYLIGRRRGRIKTERKLLPVQEKLERQVKGLHEQIAAQELRVRAAAARKHEIVSVSSVQQKEQRADQVSELRKKAERVNPTKNTKENKSPEAPLVHTVESQKAEKIVEATEVSHEVQEKILSPKSAERLTLPLLLEIAADIKLGETSLRSMYERGAVDQKNLRLIIKKYLEGERLDKIWPEALKQDLPGSERQKELGLDLQTDDPVTPIHLTEEAEQAIAAAKQRALSDDMASNSASVPIENSPVIQAILDNQSNEEEKKQPLPSIVLIVGFVIVALLFFLIFG